jgi:hypothetical protein
VVTRSNEWLPRFTDVQWMVRGQENLQGLAGVLAPETAIALQRCFIHYFFDTYVKGEAREFPRAAAGDLAEIALIHEQGAPVT